MTANQLHAPPRTVESAARCTGSGTNPTFATDQQA
jgi:hypothetical protein